MLTNKGYMLIYLIRYYKSPSCFSITLSNLLHLLAGVDHSGRIAWRVENYQPCFGVIAASISSALALKSFSIFVLDHHRLTLCQNYMIPVTYPVRREEYYLIARIYY
jgi:hypothetical protein